LCCDLAVAAAGLRVGLDLVLAEHALRWSRRMFRSGIPRPRPDAPIYHGGDAFMSATCEARIEPNETSLAGLHDR